MKAYRETGEDRTVRILAFMSLTVLALILSAFLIWNNWFRSVDYPVLTGKININTAPVESLSRLPGIGETLAQKIVDYRLANDSDGCKAFNSIEDLTDINGIGAKKAKQISEYIDF